MVDPATRAVSKSFVQKLRTRKRLVALFGKGPQLREALTSAAPYRRRFEQSAVVIVPISAGEPAEAHEAVEVVIGGDARTRGSQWLASATNERRWRAYFEELLEERGGTGGRSLWVALNFSGRVFGSNFGSPVWDELLAAMPPRNALLSTDPASVAAESAEVLAAQAYFYESLCKGDEDGVARLFAEEDDPELSFEVQVDNTGTLTNLSKWSIVLGEGARPELTIASQDAVFRGAREAVTTCIEFPVLGPTLLATQIWRQATPAEFGEGILWKLKSHRSIPYAPRVEARVALRCDHRGCIAFGKQFDAMR